MQLSHTIVLLQLLFSGDISHANLCENLYFQPNAQEKMQQFQCDIQEVSDSIYKVTSWKTYF